MRRKYSLILPLLAAFSLAGCDSLTSMVEGEQTGEEQDESDAQLISQPETTQNTVGGGESADGATPMADRIATIGLLNKRNNVSQDFEMRPGESVEEGPVIVKLEACERTAPYEFPQETGAFVQLDVLERGESDHTRVFSGWLFKENPSLNVVEHPVYDVWVKDCAMSFPGDE